MRYDMILTLLGAAALFLFGISTARQGLRLLTGKLQWELLNTKPRNLAAGMWKGTLASVLSQDSAATSVVSIGYASAGLFSLTQAAGLILGAGTGGAIIPLILAFRPEAGALCAAGGILLYVFGRKERYRQTGTVLLGFGAAFAGMSLMGASAEILHESELFSSLMTGTGNPFLGVLLGAGAAGLFQDPVAIAGVLQVLAEQGLAGMDSGFYVLTGTVIGACAATLLSSVGAGLTARRAAVLHLLAGIFSAVVLITAAQFFPVALAVSGLAAGARLQTALLYAAIAAAAAILPMPVFCVLARVSKFIVHGNEKSLPEPDKAFFDERMLIVPDVAAGQLFKDCCLMGRETMDQFRSISLAYMNCGTGESNEDNLRKDADKNTANRISHAFSSLERNSLSKGSGLPVYRMVRAVQNMKSISGHTSRLTEIADENQSLRAGFSDKTITETEELLRRTDNILSCAIDSFSGEGITPERLISLEIEKEQHSELAHGMRSAQIERMKDKKVTHKAGAAALDMTVHMESIANHAMDIAISTAAED